MKSIKSDTEDIYNITKNSVLSINQILWKIWSRTTFKIYNSQKCCL